MAAKDAVAERVKRLHRAFPEASLRQFLRERDFGAIPLTMLLRWAEKEDLSAAGIRKAFASLETSGEDRDRIVALLTLPFCSDYDDEDRSWLGELVLDDSLGLECRIGAAAALEIGDGAKQLEDCVRSMLGDVDRDSRLLEAAVQRVWRLEDPLLVEQLRADLLGEEGTLEPRPAFWVVLARSGALTFAELQNAVQEQQTGAIRGVAAHSAQRDRQSVRRVLLENSGQSGNRTLRAACLANVLQEGNRDSWEVIEESAARADKESAFAHDLERTLLLLDSPVALGNLPRLKRVFGRSPGVYQATRRAMRGIAIELKWKTPPEDVMAQVREVLRQAIDELPLDCDEQHEVAMYLAWYGDASDVGLLQNVNAELNSRQLELEIAQLRERLP